MEKIKKIDDQKIREIIQNNSDLIEYAEYIFSRNDIPYSICSLKLDYKSNTNIDIDVQRFIRKTDKVLYKSANIFILLFSFTNEENAHKAVYSLERNIIGKIGCDYRDFNAGICEKKENITTEEMIKKSLAGLKSSILNLF